MSKILLIIDPQYDFITGSLAVNGAEQAMQNLAVYMQQPGAFDAIYITTDQHPQLHCSFKEQGGLWPVHCLKYSKGAAIHQLIQSELNRLSAQNINYKIIQKGQSVDQEEYSGFKRQIPTNFFWAQQILVTGIAGDYCVFESVTDLVAAGLGKKLLILTDCIVSIDGGTKLTEYCQLNNLATTRATEQ